MFFRFLDFTNICYSSTSGENINTNTWLTFDLTTVYMCITIYKFDGYIICILYGGCKLIFFFFLNGEH